MDIEADMVHESWPMCVCNIVYVLSLNYFKFKLRERAFHFYGGGRKMFSGLDMFFILQII